MYCGEAMKFTPIQAANYSSISKLIMTIILQDPVFDNRSAYVDAPVAVANAWVVTHAQ